MDEIRLWCQHFSSFFRHMLLTHKKYIYDANNTVYMYSAFPRHRQYSADQILLPLALGLINEWYMEESDPVYVYEPDTFNDKFLR